MGKQLRFTPLQLVKVSRLIYNRLVSFSLRTKYDHREERGDSNRLS